MSTITLLAKALWKAAFRMWLEYRMQNKAFKQLSDSLKDTGWLCNCKYGRTIKLNEETPYQCRECRKAIPCYRCDNPAHFVVDDISLEVEFFHCGDPDCERYCTRRVDNMTAMNCDPIIDN